MHFAVASSLAGRVITAITRSWTRWRARRLQGDRLYWLADWVSVLFANCGIRLSQRMDKHKLQGAFAGFWGPAGSAQAGLLERWLCPAP